MDVPAGQHAAGAEIVGRESELAAVARFLEGNETRQALLISGEAGIGKTTLWESAVVMARERGFRVLVARPSEPELQLAFVGLSDLLDDVDLGKLGPIPLPQLRALEVALMRRDPDGAPPDRLGLATGLTRVLRALSDRVPSLVAIDDVPWLDQPSEAALVFAARRVRGRSITFLLARRPGDPLAIEKAFGPRAIERVEIGPLSLGAVRQLLVERLGLRPPRRVLLRLFELSQGSPLVALELGRVLVTQGLPDVGEELPLPDLVDELFAERIAGLAAPTRRALLAVALSGGLTRLELASLVGPLALEDSVAARVLAVDGSRVRPSHPLLAAAARRSASAEERREVHRALAQTSDDETIRARHLALATSRKNAALAMKLSTVAADAVGRGAIHDAIAVAEQALRLTPVTSPGYTQRLLELARYLTVAGEQTRVHDLLEARLSSLPRGRDRARALLMLSDTGGRLSETEAYVDRALEECRGDAEVRSSALSLKALVYAIVRFRKLEEAEDWAHEALELARSVDPSAEGRALHALAWINLLRGRSFETIGRVSASSARGASLYESALERPAGIRLMVRGQIDESREVFDRLRALAGQRGEALSASVMHRQLCEIELRAGDIYAAERHLDQWGEWTLPDDDHEQVLGPARCRALLEAVRGDPDHTARWAATAIAAAEALENFREETEARRAVGIAALHAHDPARAVEQLRPLWLHAEREGIDDPGAIPVGPDLVEALVELNEYDEAHSVTKRLERLAHEQKHPWALLGVERCRALIDLATGGHPENATARLAHAAAGYRRLGLQFDSARSLLILGRTQRRRKKWAAARSALEDAAATFTKLGASGWADEASGELSRVAGRRGLGQGVLTPAESRVAELAAAGLSNKEIATRLVVSIHTVERHLKHVYAKLGIRSRSQLASHLSADGRP